MYAKEPEDIKRWDLDYYKRISKFRCITMDQMETEYVPYNKVFEQEEQEEKNGAYLVDHIISKRFFPNGLPVIYGACEHVRNDS